MSGQLCEDCNQREATVRLAKAHLCQPCKTRLQDGIRANIAEREQAGGVNLCDPTDIDALHAGTLDEPDETGEWDLEEQSYADQIRAAILTTGDLKNIPRPAPLIEGLLYLDSLAMLYGPSGAGKSFVMIDWAMHVASSHEWWINRAVTNGGVLYVAAEGVRALSVGSTLVPSNHH